MLATQFARDINVRKVVREIFHAKATISVVPTRKGLAEIDENHPLFP
jgi:transcription elongation factor SPT6